ncbi:hypothetical protein MMC11_004760 [Xylographa trunciseda]|nr:hypothetical protein [Xylographa trunciseda]
MASSTFKSVSDTIRSKAQIFYVDAERPDTQLHVEATDGGTHEYKPSIFSSLRSRTSRNKLNSDFQSSVTTTSQTSEMPHEIHVEIPGSTLLETMGLPRKVTITDKAHTTMPLTTISLLAVASSRSSTDMLASSTSLKQFITDVNTDANETDSEGSAYGVSHINDTQNRLKAGLTLETDCGNDPESGSNKETSDLSLAHSSYHIGVSHHAITASTRSHLGGNLFVKGNREHTRIFGTPSPYRRALQLSEGAASDSFASASYGIHEVENNSQEDGVGCRPPLRQTTSISNGLNGLVMISPAQVPPASNVEIEFNSSEAYDADEEYGSERSEEPSMGPKSSWDKARADRQRRYQFVRTMSAETASDHSDVSGLELHLMKDQSKIRDNTSNVTPEGTSSVATPSSGRRVHFESPSNHAVFTQSRMLTSQMVTEDSTVEITPNQVQTDALECSVKAIERPAGVELELTDGGRNQNTSNLEVLKPSGAPNLLTMPSSYLQENRWPNLGLQMRTSSVHSDTTSSSCAITTSSQLCYQPISEESCHVRANHVQSTSSIISDTDQIRNDLAREKPELESPIFRPLIEEPGYIGITEVPVIVREDATRPPTYAERFLESAANNSMSMTVNDTAKEESKPPSCYETSRTSSLRLDKPDIFVEELSAEMLPPLTVAGSTSYHESLADMKIHRSMPGAFVPSPEKPSSISSSRSSQEDRTRENTPKMSVSMKDLRPNSVDFSIMNPEVDHYLAQAFSNVPYRVTESEYSDEENGFRTPITTPIKHNHSMKSYTCSGTELTGQTERTCQPRDTSNSFVAARLPKFAVSPADSIDYLHREKGINSACNEYTLESVMIPKDNPSSASLSGKRHSIEQGWQMKDINNGDGDFADHSVDSPHIQLQTSSLKKGVWWTRVQEILKESESPCAERQMLQTLDDGLDNAKDPLRSIEGRMHEINMNINDSTALLEVEHTPKLRDGPDSPCTERQVDGWEDDKTAIPTERHFTNENGVQQNRESLNNSNLLLATATPFVREFIAGRSPNHTERNGKEDIQWDDGQVITKCQVRAPSGDEENLNPVDEAQQDQDANSFATLFSRSIALVKGRQALQQEIETSMESLQGEEMVRIDGPNVYIIGPVPHAIRHDRLRNSKNSWYSFEID